MDRERRRIRRPHHAITQREIVLDEILELVEAQVRPIQRREQLDVGEAACRQVSRREGARPAEIEALKVVVAGLSRGSDTSIVSTFSATSLIFLALKRFASAFHSPCGVSSTSILM